MEMEDDGQIQNWAVYAGLGCLILVIVGAVAGMVVWWAITGSTPTFGLFGP